MQRKLVKTEDGSHSLFVEALDENYHSIYGAIQEAKHVFIEAGLHYFKAKAALRILEIGFGTGLNAFVTYLENQTNQQQIDYVGVEAFPVVSSEYNMLNYAKELEADVHQSQFLKLHEVAWEGSQTIDTHFKLTKLETTFEALKIASYHFDIIYFDAFAPSAQPELWSQEIFDKMYAALKPNGILVTYCAKGVVKRTMKAAGFTIEGLPGPKGKREMTRAIKLPQVAS